MSYNGRALCICKADVWFPTCISLDELDCAVETINPNPQCLTAAKLIYFSQSILMLDHHDELFHIHSGSSQQRLHLNTCFHDNRGRERPKNTAIMSIHFLFVKASHRDKFDVIWVKNYKHSPEKGRVNLWITILCPMILHS